MLSPCIYVYFFVCLIYTQDRYFHYLVILFMFINIIQALLMLLCELLALVMVPARFLALFAFYSLLVACLLKVHLLGGSCATEFPPSCVRIL